MAAQLIKFIESEFALRVSLRAVHKYFCLSILPVSFSFSRLSLSHSSTTTGLLWPRKWEEQGPSWSATLEARVCSATFSSSLATVSGVSQGALSHQPGPGRRVGWGVE